MRVLVAPDSAGGTLDPAEMAAAIADGWRRERPGDEVTTLPLADGGEGLLAAVAASSLPTTEHVTEVVGPDGLAAEARWLLAEDGDEIMLITKAGTLVRTRVDEISRLGRNTQGVKLISLDEDEYLMGVARVEGLGEDDEPEGDEGDAD